jgi:hypothetical protein
MKYYWNCRRTGASFSAVLKGIEQKDAKLFFLSLKVIRRSCEFQFKIMIVIELRVCGNKQHAPGKCSHKPIIE